MRNDLFDLFSENVDHFVLASCADYCLSEVANRGHRIVCRVCVLKLIGFFIFRETGSGSYALCCFRKLLGCLDSELRLRCSAMGGYLCFELRQVGDKGPDHARIVLRTTAAKDEIDCFLTSHSFTVLPVFAHRIEAVYNGQYARGQWDVLSAQPVRITSAIPALVMVSNNRNNRIREFNTTQDLRSGNRMHLHLLEFRSGEFARLVDYVGGYSNLSDIVKQRPGPECSDLGGCASEDSRHACGVNLNAQNVIVSDFALGVNRNRQRLYGFAVGLLHHFYALLYAVPVLALSEVDREKYGTTYYEDYFQVMLKGVVHQCCGGAVGKKHRHCPKEAFEDVLLMFPVPKNKERRE